MVLAAEQVEDFDGLSRARSLNELVTSQAALNEERQTLTPETVKALVDSRLPWMLVPTEAGGRGATLIDTVRVIEELAFADASTGWCYMVTAVSSGLVAAFVGDDAVKVLYADEDRPFMAGMTGPRGTADMVEGGFQCGGKYSFGSGARHANWIKSGAMVRSGGEPVTDSHGVPAQIAFVVPADNVELQDNWHVLGLKGTGSVDYSVPAQFVPEDFTFSLNEVQQRRGRATFQIGVKGMAAAGHGAVALGMGRHALHEIARISREKVRPGLPSVADRELFKHDFSFHDAALRSARAFTWETIAESEAHVESGRPLTDTDLYRLRQACTYSHKVAAEAIRFAYGWAGTTSLREPSDLGRVLRDLSGATQHFYVDPSSLVDAAPSALRSY